MYRLQILDEVYDENKKYLSELKPNARTTKERIQIFNDFILNNKKTVAKNLGVKTSKAIKNILRPIQNDYSEPDVSKILDASSIEECHQLIEAPTDTDIVNLLFNWCAIDAFNKNTRDDNVISLDEILEKMRNLLRGG